MSRIPGSLHEALEGLGIERFESLLALGADPNEPDNYMDDNRIIFNAAIQDDPRFAQALIRAGANVQVRNSRKETPLFNVYSVKVAESLIAAGLDVNSMDNERGRALDYAFAKGDAKLVELLVRHGAKSGEREPEPPFLFTPLHVAAFGGNKKAVELLVAHGADIEARAEHDRTALWYAATEAKKRHLSTLAALLAAGANPNAAAENGDTPLMRAAMANSPAGVRLLLDAGADVNAIQNDGHTALIWAIREGHADVATMLQEAGATPDVRVIATSRDAVCRGKTAREMAGTHHNATLRTLFDHY